MTQTKFRQEQLPVDTDGTMAANSDAVVPSQKAVVTFVNAHSGGGAGSGIVGQDEATTLGTGTILNVVGNNISLSLSGTVFTLLHTNPTGTPYSFLDLTDTPDSYSGQGSKFVAVNTGANGLEFVNSPAGTGGSGVVIYDDSVYKVTGTSISFDGGLSVVTTGSVAYVSSGISLIQEISPVGTGTVSFQSIPQTYRHLRMEWLARGTQSATNTNISVYFNNDSTATNYRRTLLYGYGGTTTVGADVGDDALVDSITAATAPANSSARGTWDISYYKETIFYKTLLSISSQRRDTSTFQIITYRNSMEWENTSAISRIDVILASGNFMTGSSFSLYGIM